MRVSTFIPNVFLLSGAAAQTFSTYTDTKTGIKFWQADVPTSQTAGGLQVGFALPAAGAGMEDEYIGHVVGALDAGAGWSGLSHGGAMTDSLLLVLWPNGQEIMSSFRYASAYVAPDLYSGNATLSTISSSVNDTHFEIIYRCQNCWVWDYAGTSGSQIPATTASAQQIVGWVQATALPTTPDDPDSAILEHQDDNIAGIAVASARNTAYTSWVSLATATATGVAPTGTGNSTSVNGTAPFANATSTSTGAIQTTVPCQANNTIPQDTYDYIVVGAGAGGIPLAAKLTEAGHSVLLIERGPPSSGRWGGDMKPTWLQGTNLTRFDVPGLCNEIWADSAGIACPDASSMAGCVLGGGTAVNAALWWKANPADFDENFPAGWKAADMQPSIDRVFEKIPWTDHPSADGELYLPRGYDVVGSALAASGWKNVTANDVPEEKNMTFSHTPYMYNHGERFGPMATYLVEANASSNFQLWMNTTVQKVLRNGSHITGVEVAAYGQGGYCGTVNVTPNTGRVILSAGVFGTSKILMRSGIGPTDQLNIVKASSEDGASMIDSSQWINLPVGQSLDDHTNTDVVIQQAEIPQAYYDWYGAYTAVNTSDQHKYLATREGILTQSAPNIGPMFWDEITGSDGSVRQLQWTARVEGSHSITGNNTMTLSQYLGRGKTSKGRLTINSALVMTVSDPPYQKTAEDIAAVIQGIKNLQAALSSDSSITMMYPSANTTVESFVSTYPNTVSYRTANHWIGTSRLGLDSGLVNNGTSVVDLDTKVYGTDNLFVVDASIFPGMMTTNPSALIVAVAEHAAERILALAATNGTVVNATTAAVSSLPPFANGTSIILPSGTGTVGPASASGILPTGSLSVAPASASGVSATGTGTVGAVSASASASLNPKFHHPKPHHHKPHHHEAPYQYGAATHNKRFEGPRHV